MGKIVITGTGRCGTSFLMHLFTALGLNTGYTLDECEQHLAQSKCSGGIEHSIGTERFEKADIVKNPEWFYKPELLDIRYIDCFIIPIRPLVDVAFSRDRNNGYGGFHQGAETVTGQMNIDAKAFFEFMYIYHDHKIIFMDFPRITRDPKYLWSKIKLFECVNEEAYFEYLEIFNKIAKPEKVHI